MWNLFGKTRKRATRERSDNREKTGRRGERYAERYLKKKGYRLAERNLRRKAGEIDLVMWDGEDLVIVEVRTVHLHGEGPLEERIPYRKRRQLVRLARGLVAELPDPLPPVRFDLCVVILEPERRITHFRDAFTVDELNAEQ